jgi:NAD(P)-dependent dehydrogenase (short-subunit alcohol dehydrogenase family)
MDRYLCAHRRWRGAAKRQSERKAGARHRGSAGLGVESARALAAHGAQVIGAARDLSKAQGATEQVRAQATRGGSLRLVQLDLASLDSVRRCADGLLAAGKLST